MFVKDYEFIQNIDVLFEKKIIIYGAGKIGKITAELLDDISVNFDCFCDMDQNKKQELSHPVITIEELKVKTEKEECLVIVGSHDYCQEMIEELQNRQIDAYICTWYGIRTGIEFNRKDRRIPEEFSRNLIRRKEIWMKAHNMCLLSVDAPMCLSVYPVPVLVYQPGKVGSMTIHKTLLDKKIDAVHIHYFFHDRVLHINGGYEYVERPDSNITFLVSLIRKRRNPLKIIIAVREPIARALADFMQRFSSDFVSGYNEEKTIEENANDWIRKVLTEDREFTWWFDKELKELTGIDIYDYPFDRESGYTWIKENGIEILLLKMEQMNDNIDVIGEFVGKPDIHFINDNVGSNKQYKYIYEELKKRIKIPSDLIKQQYHDNKRMDHFYTEEQKRAFIQKWT